MRSTFPFNRSRIAATVSCALLLGCAPVGHRSGSAHPRASHSGPDAPGAMPSGGADARGIVREGTPDEVNLAKLRMAETHQMFRWSEWSAETFERARRENKPILIDGAAAWCHWCHVMDETTYADPEIGAVLRDQFVTIRIDIDERPDLAERYGDWGWPATILLTPDGHELGKYRGYLPPAAMQEILDELERAKATLASGDMTTADLHLAGGPPTSGNEIDPLFDRVPAPEQLGWVAASVANEMNGYYDPTDGGWGFRQKAPLGANAEFEVWRASRGDGAAGKRAAYALHQQRVLMDPVWGGIYQYSAAEHWYEPHFEKLMAYQASNIEAYARAYAHTQNPAFFRDANSIARYIETHLTNAAGAFLASQDADIGAHDRGAEFVDGHFYYRLDDQGRRAIGMPRVDPAVYPSENGRAIAALCTLLEVGADPTHLERARKAADHILATYVDRDGRVYRGEDRSVDAVRYLADAAGFSRGLARLAVVTGDDALIARTKTITDRMLSDFRDARNDRTMPASALYASTEDPAAAGVFALRRRPFEQNVLAARALAAAGTAERAPGRTAEGRALLAAISTPRNLSKQGRMLGEYLLAAAELGLLD